MTPSTRTVLSRASRSSRHTHRPTSSSFRCRSPCQPLTHPANPFHTRIAHHASPPPCVFAGASGHVTARRAGGVGVVRGPGSGDAAAPLGACRLGRVWSKATVLTTIFLVFLVSSGSAAHGGPTHGCARRPRRSLDLQPKRPKVRLLCSFAFLCSLLSCMANPSLVLSPGQPSTALLPGQSLPCPLASTCRSESR